MKGLINKERWITVVLVAIFFLAWEWSAGNGFISKFIFPQPSRVFASMIELTASGELTENLFATLTRLFFGFLLGGIPGLLIGLFMGWRPRIRRMLTPVISALHPIPKIALFPILLVLFGIGETSMSILIALAVFFPTLVNAMEGARQINTVYLEVASNVNASRWLVFRRIIFPSSLPFVFAGAQIALNIGLIVTISVEMLQGRNGLGRMMWFGWQMMRLEQVYSVIFIIGIMGLAINALINACMRWFAPWYDIRGQAEY